MFVFSLPDIRHIDIIFMWSLQNYFCLVYRGFSQCEKFKWLYLPPHKVIMSPLLTSWTCSLINIHAGHHWISYLSINGESSWIISSQDISRNFSWAINHTTHHNQQSHSWLLIDEIGITMHVRYVHFSACFSLDIFKDMTCISRHMADACYLSLCAWQTSRCF